MSRIEIDNVEDVIEKTVNRFGTISGLSRYTGCRAKVVILEDQEKTAWDIANENAQKEE